MPAAKMTGAPEPAIGPIIQRAKGRYTPTIRQLEAVKGRDDDNGLERGGETKGRRCPTLASHLSTCPPPPQCSSLLPLVVFLPCPAWNLCLPKTTPRLKPQNDDYIQKPLLSSAGSLNGESISLHARICMYLTGQSSACTSDISARMHDHAPPRKASRGRHVTLLFSRVQISHGPPDSDRVGWLLIVKGQRQSGRGTRRERLASISLPAVPWPATSGN